MVLAPPLEIRAQKYSPVSAGGYLVPAETVAQILQSVFEDRLLALPTQVTGNSRAIVENSLAEGEWLTEGQTATLQDTAITANLLSVAPRLVAAAAITTEAFQDFGADFDNLLANENIRLLLIPRIQRSLRRAIATGNGIGQPMGLAVSSQIANTSAAISIAALTTMVTSVAAGYLERPTCGWVINPSDLKTIVELASQPPNFISYTPAPLLMGFPIYLNSYMPSGSVIFGDLSRYLLKIQTEMIAVADRNSRAINGEIVIALTMRVDGCPIVAASGQVSLVRLNGLLSFSPDTALGSSESADPTFTATGSAPFSPDTASGSAAAVDVTFS